MRQAVGVAGVMAATGSNVCSASAQESTPGLQAVLGEAARRTESVFLTAPERIPVEFFAGGEFENPAIFNDRIFWHTDSQTYVGLSLSMLRSLENELMEVYGIDTPTFEAMHNLVSLRISDWGYSSFFSRAQARSCLLLDISGAYVLRSETNSGRVVSSMLTDGQEKRLVYTDAAFYKPDIAWNDKYGLVATDGLRITDRFESELGQFVELENYELIGSPHQVVGRKLKELQELGVVEPLEVSRFENSRELSGYKTFRILPNTKGDPTIVLLISEKEYGLATDFGLVDAIVQACRRLNEIDPDGNNKLNVEYLNKQYNLWVIGGDTPPETFVTNKDFSASFNAARGIIKINKQKYNVASGGGLVANVMGMLLLESRHIYSFQHFIWNGKTHELMSRDRRHLDGGLDKAVYVIELIERVRNRLTDTEYQIIRWIADATHELYSQRLAMQGES